MSSGPMSTGTIGRLGLADVVAQAAEPLVQPLGVGPEPLTAIGLGLDHLERRQHAGGIGRRQRRGEDERPAVMLEVVDDVLAARHEAADRRQRLGEGAGDDVDLVRQPEVRRGALAVGAEDAEGVRVIDGEGGAVLLGDANQLRHVRDVAFHRVDAVDDDHARRGCCGSVRAAGPGRPRSPWLKRTVSP